MPFLLNSSMTSLRSRRPSTCLTSSQGSGLLQQLGSGMVRQLTLGSGSSLHHHPPGSGGGPRSFPNSNVRNCPAYRSAYYFPASKVPILNKRLYPVFVLSSIFVSSRYRPTVIIIFLFFNFFFFVQNSSTFDMHSISNVSLIACSASNLL